MPYVPADGFPYYFDLAKNADVHALFASQAGFDFLATIGEENAGFRYAKNKWSIKQVVGHIADHERIKMFRAFLLSRNQPVELWGYDQDALIANSRFDDLPFSQLLSDLKALRRSSISFINTLSEQQFALKAMARGHEITLEAFLRSIIGHEIHHVNIIKEKYLIG
jgi:hypothetical protein